MVPTFGRIRGLLLRAAYSRAPALAVGSALVAPAITLWLAEFSWESWLTDGLALVLGATGTAFIAAGFQGRRRDWVE